MGTRHALSTNTDMQTKQSYIQNEEVFKKIKKKLDAQCKMKLSCCLSLLCNQKQFQTLNNYLEYILGNCRYNHKSNRSIIYQMKTETREIRYFTFLDVP